MLPSIRLVVLIERHSVEENGKKGEHLYDSTRRILNMTSGFA